MARFIDTLERSLELHFARAVVLLVLFYCAVESAYVLRLPLVMDEFDGAYEAWRLRSSVPYRDFVPYKTVLGYYLQLPTTFLAATVWNRLMAMKLALVAFNGVMLGALAVYCSRFVRKAPLALSLLLLAVSTPFLERSAELRVDMLTAWAGVWSMILLVRGRYALAGLTCALSFLVSQKGALYVVAAETALVAGWVAGRLERRSIARGFAWFNASAAALLAAYLLGWSSVTSMKTVIEPTFFSAARAAAWEGHAIRTPYWTHLLVRNPGYVALTVVAVAMLLWWRGSRTQVVVAAYAFAIALQAAVYPQPWPYFFVLVLPPMFLLHATFMEERKQRAPHLPFGLSRGTAAVLLIAAVVFPAHRIAVALARDNAYQRYNVRLAESLLRPDDRYLAGNDIVHERTQSPAAFARTDGIVLQRLRDEWPRVRDGALTAMDVEPPLLIFGNYRTYSLPRPFLELVASRYARFSGSVLLYAPMVGSGMQRVRLHFPGVYEIDSRDRTPVAIDGRRYPSGARVTLAAGTREVVASGPARLRLIPPGAEARLDSRFVDERPFYPNVYDY